MARRDSPRGPRSKYAAYRALNVLHPLPDVNASLLPDSTLRREPVHLAQIYSDAMHGLRLLRRTGKTEDEFGFFSGEAERDVATCGLKPFCLSGALINRLLGFARRQNLPALLLLANSSPGTLIHSTQNKFLYVHMLLDAACNEYESRFSEKPSELALQVRDLTAPVGRWTELIVDCVMERVRQAITAAHPGQYDPSRTRSGYAHNQITTLVDSTHVQSRWKSLWWKMMQGKVTSRDMPFRTSEILNSFGRRVYRANVDGPFDLAEGRAPERNPGVEAQLPLTPQLLFRCMDRPPNLDNSRVVSSALSAALAENLEEALRELRNLRRPAADTYTSDRFRDHLGLLL